MERLIFKISEFILGYISFISSVKAYMYLTVLSEVLNIFRIIPAVLMCKVVVDLHREMMKIILFTK